MSAISRNPVSLSTKLYYGFGSVAYGAKNNGLNYFLLIYYNQVLGLPAPWVGLILMIALLTDAISDPLMGYISDNWHSKWGRRHPFMYAAALPVTLAYFLLWNPPNVSSQTALFWWALSFTIAVRLIITAYETPSSSLAAELTENYHERTELLSFRYAFGWFGGAGMAIISYLFLLRPNQDYPVGQLNPEGYQMMGLIGASVILFAIMVSALGTHRHIPHLKSPPPKRSFSAGRVFRELYQTLSNYSFIVIFISAVFMSIASGISISMTLYMMTYFWEFSATQLGLLTFLNFVSALIALVISPAISRMLGKKLAAIVIAGAAFTLLPLPVVLRLFDLLPPNGTENLFYLFSVFFIIDIALIISASILIASMVADLVEDSQISTGRRSEGVFFATQTFVTKSLVGVGAMISTFLLVLIGFPERAVVGELSPETVRNLGIAYAGGLLCFYSLGIFFLSFYKIDETRHNQNLASLETG